MQIGDEVITIGGILGTIRELTDEKIELEVAPGVVITVARNAIAQMAQPASDALGDGRVDEGEVGE